MISVGEKNQYRYHIDSRTGNRGDLEREGGLDGWGDADVPGGHETNIYAKRMDIRLCLVRLRR